MGKAREKLIKEHVVPHLNAQHQCISLRDGEFHTALGYVDPGYLLDGLGPGWTMQTFLHGGGVVFMRTIPLERAQAQISERFPSDKGS